MHPLVSIVINNYNYGRYVRQAIDSAFAQTYPNIEVIIVDDGSQDESRNIIREYEGRAAVVLKDNGGQASTFNVGIARARGRFALLLDSDDFLFPDAIASCVRVFPDGYSRLFFRLKTVDAEGHPVRIESPANRFEAMDGLALLPSATCGEIYLGPPTSANFLDLRMLRSVLPIPEGEYRLCADAFILAKTSVKGPVKSLDQELGAYRIHDRNAFFVSSKPFSNPRKVSTQIDNLFTSRAVIRDACKEVGTHWDPPPLERTFWYLHLLSAGLVWKLDNANLQKISQRQILVMTCNYLLRGQDPLGKRAVRTMYLLVVLLAPARLARRLLHYVDRRLPSGAAKFLGPDHR